MAQSGMNADRSRASHNPSIGKGFGGGKASWNSNIWGDNNLGNVFAEGRSPTRPCYRPHAIDAALGQHPSFEGKSGSGSLLSTSESDGWGGRSHLPWSTASLSLGQHKGVAAGPVHSRPSDRIAPATSETVDPTSYFALPRSSGIGTSAASNGPKAFLTSGPEGISPSGDGFPSLSGFKYGEGRRPANPSTFGSTHMSSGSSIRGTFSGPLDPPRSDEVGGSMTMPSLSHATPDTMSQPLIRGPYNHTSHNSASFTPQRPVHSAAPSFHSESQGLEGRYASGSMDINAGLNKLQLNESGLSGQFHRPPYLSHASYDGSLQRVKYPSDDGGYQAGAGYGAEGTADLALAHQAGKSPIGECDRIALEYARMGSPFYSVENPGAIAPQYRNNAGGRGGRLSDGQVVALERKLRGLQQEQDYAQHSANPLQRMQFPPAYDFAGYQAARLNSLSGFYPMAHLGGLGATAMVSRAHRDQDPTQVVRSPLLEEFRANSKGNKRYELKVGYMSIVRPGAWLMVRRTSTIMWLSLAATSTARVSSSRNWKLPTATRRSRCSARSSPTACS